MRIVEESYVISSLEDDKLDGLSFASEKDAVAFILDDGKPEVDYVIDKTYRVRIIQEDT